MNSPNWKALGLEDVTKSRPHNLWLTQTADSWFQNLLHDDQMTTSMKENWLSEMKSSLQVLIDSWEINENV